MEKHRKKGKGASKNFKYSHKHNSRHDSQGREPSNRPALARPNLYGHHAVAAAWLNPARHIERLYLTDQSRPKFEAVLNDARKQGLKRPEPILVDKEALERVLPRDAVHQGVALVASGLEGLDVRDLVIRAAGQARTVLVMLDQVTDPHNVGAILRSAAAFGIDGLIMQKKHAPALDGVLAKTASGAVDHVPVAEVVNLSRALEELKEGGFFVAGLDERGEKTLNEADLEQQSRIVLVLGSEGEGIRRLVQKHCDGLVRLPTGGEIASLNVSNAAAIAFYQLRKR